MEIGVQILKKISKLPVIFKLYQNSINDAAFET
jgi:hypothetical protein